MQVTKTETNKGKKVYIEMRQVVISFGMIIFPLNGRPNI